MKEEDYKLLYEKLSKKRKFLLIRSLIFIMFLFGVNAFAWFTFFSKADVAVRSHISSWEVKFKENAVEIDYVIVDINMQPGMTLYQNIVEIQNQGEVDARVSYEITSVSILGNNVPIVSQQDIINKLQNFYPYSIYFEYPTTVLAPNSTGNFVTKAEWPYEDNTAYFQLDSLYTYEPGYIYYNSSQVAQTVTSANFATLRDSLYLPKDDADSYFGEKCGAYESSTDEPCVEIHIKLIVRQV